MGSLAKIATAVAFFGLLAFSVLTSCASFGVEPVIPDCAKVVTIDGKRYVDRSGCSDYKPHREPREPRIGQ